MGPLGIFCVGGPFRPLFKANFFPNFFQFWKSKNFFGHTTIFPKDENFFPETPTMFIATVDVYLL